MAAVHQHVYKGKTMPNPENMVSTQIGRIELHFDDNGNGVIDKNAVKAFTCGQCHAFALALHAATGWPMMGIGNGLSYSPIHCVVYCPQLDTYIDINGPGAQDRYEQLFREHFFHLEPKHIRDFRYYLEPDVDMARPFARVILERIKQAYKYTFDAASAEAELCHV